MKKEYKVIVLSVREMEEVFNKMSKDGWRVVATSPNIAMGHGVICTLERDIEE